jgi:hypothetical protein
MSLALEDATRALSIGLARLITLEESRTRTPQVRLALGSVDC